MQIKTRNFGEIEIREDEIISFKKGIPGFESLKKFVILEHEPNTPFKWLQAVEEPDTAFVIMEPSAFIPTYDPKPNTEEMLELGIKDIKEALIYAIVVIPEDITQMTANLKAPIVINRQTNRGKQLILGDSEYSLKHNILDEMQKLKAGDKEKNAAVND